MSWRDQARCAGHPGVMDLKKRPGQNQRLQQLVAARPLVEQFCGNCPVITQCQQWADEEQTFGGVAGGRVYILGEGANTHAQSYPVVPRPDLGEWVMRYQAGRPNLAHLAHPDAGLVPAACGVRVSAGQHGETIERVMCLPRCRQCQQVTGVIMPQPVKQQWRDPKRFNNSPAHRVYTEAAS